MNRMRGRPNFPSRRDLLASVGATCVVTLLTVAPAWAQLETPGLRDAYLLEPCQFLFNADASAKFKQVLGTDQHYLVHEHIEDFGGGHERWDYQACSLEAFAYEISEEPAGVFYLDTIGTDPQSIASVIWTIYAATPAGQVARNDELQHDLNVAGLTALDVYPIDIFFNGAFYPAVAIRPSGLAKMFHGTNALVYINASWGNFSSSSWPGSRARLSYSTDIDISMGVSDANTFFGRLNGEFGKTLRSTASAVTGTSLVHSGLPIALSPTVVRTRQ
jgi:hypothetical protein